MRYLLAILLFLPFSTKAQVIRANPLYRPQSTFLLDTYTGASAAYSFRKLRSNYTGNCVRVRRSSDNTEQDFGFVNNYLDTAGIRLFVTTNNGFITVWYEQTGNGYNMANATATEQPSIMNAGVFRTINGKPAIYFDGTNDNFAATITGFQSYTALSLICVDATVTTQVADGAGLTRASFGNAVLGRGWAFFNPTSALSGEKITMVTDKAAATGRLGCSTYTFTGGTQYTEWFNVLTNSTAIYKNGTQATIDLTSGATTTSNNTPNATGYVADDIVRVQALNNGGTLYGTEGYFSEWILYNSSQLSNRSGIEGNIRTYYANY